MHNVKKHQYSPSATLRPTTSFQTRQNQNSGISLEIVPLNVFIFPQQWKRFERLLYSLLFCLFSMHKTPLNVFPPCLFFLKMDAILSAAHKAKTFSLICIHHSASKLHYRRANHSWPSWRTLVSTGLNVLTSRWPLPPPTGLHLEPSPDRRAVHVGPQPFHLARSLNPSRLPHGGFFSVSPAVKDFLLQGHKKPLHPLTKGGSVMKRALRVAEGLSLCVCVCAHVSFCVLQPRTKSAFQVEDAGKEMWSNSKSPAPHAMCVNHGAVHELRSLPTPSVKSCAATFRPPLTRWLSCCHWRHAEKRPVSNSARSQKCWSACFDRQRAKGEKSEIFRGRLLLYIL